MERPTVAHSTRRAVTRVVSLSDIIKGTAAAPHCDAALPMPCPRCGSRAVLPLDAATLAKQLDETTHVCHPALDGCNHGFGIIETEAPRIV